MLTSANEANVRVEILATCETSNIPYLCWQDYFARDVWHRSSADRVRYMSVELSGPVAEE